MNNYQNHPLAGAVDLDSAMAKLWAFYKKYFIGLYVISVVLALVSSAVTAGIDLSALQTTTDPYEMLKMMKGMAGPYAIMIISSLVAGVLLHTWVLERPMGESDFVASLLRKSLVALVPYIVTMIIFSIIAAVLTAIGLVMLVLPGFFAIFYIATVMVFAMPVTLVETSNPARVVPRSFALAHRNLWPNMGWMIVLILIIIVISLVISALVMIPFSGSFIRSLTNPEEASSIIELARNPIYVGLSALTSSLITPVLPILAFILYFKNRAEEVAVETAEEKNDTVKVEDLYPRMPENN